MPTYTYQCDECGLMEDFVFRIAERPESLPCVSENSQRLTDCLGTMHQIITAPNIRVDTAADVPWLSEFARTRKEARFGGKPIETRAEYKQYMKDHNLRHVDGENLSTV